MLVVKLFTKRANQRHEKWRAVILPHLVHACLSCPPEVSMSLPSESGLACDFLLPMEYSRNDYASSRLSLKKSGSFCFCSLGSQQPCCRVLARIPKEDRPPVEGGHVEEHWSTPIKLSDECQHECRHVSDPTWKHMKKDQPRLWRPAQAAKLWIAFPVGLSLGNTAQRHNEGTKGDNQDHKGSGEEDYGECQRSEFSEFSGEEETF